MLNTCAAFASPALSPEAEAAEHELATLSAHLDAATHRQLELIRIIDDSGRWYAQGAASCVHWLGWRIGLDAGAARERLRVAHALASLPLTDDALRRGALSYSKARAITRVATPGNEARLLELARCSTAAQLEKICRGLRKLESDAAPGEPRDVDRWVVLRPRGDGTVRVEATLLPDEATRVMEAIRATCAAMREEGATRPTLADGLVRMADAALAAASDDDVAHDDAASPDDAPDAATAPFDVPAKRTKPPTRTTGADRAQVVVHLAPDALDEGYQTTLDDGVRISTETFRRVACDCALVAVKKGEDGEVLDVGRKTRSIPPALRRAVMLRDARCRFPGCTHERFIDVHHVEHWMHGGETKLSNLVALCTHHHRLLHEGGFTMELGRGREARFFTPHGKEIPAAHVSAEAPREPGRALEARHRARGIVIDDATGMSFWDGRAPDYRACVAAAAGVGF